MKIQLSSYQMKVFSGFFINLSARMVNCYFCRKRHYNLTLNFIFSILSLELDLKLKNNSLNMIDLDRNVSLAQIAFALGIIAWAVVWKLRDKNPPRK